MYKLNSTAEGQPAAAHFCIPLDGGSEEGAGVARRLLLAAAFTAGIVVQHALAVQHKEAALPGFAEVAGLLEQVALSK